MLVVERQRFEASAGKDSKIDPADGENRQQMEKRYHFDGTKLPIY
jgi:hypothetical protein